jgi:GT2 family glycosyltransferase
MKVISSSVWIVIPTYNRSTDLVECLQSVQALEGGPYSILVVDNGSTDDTIIQLETHFPSCTIIKLTENKGAAEAANVGFNYALARGAELILRLDSDTVVAPDFLAQLLSESEKEPQTGILTGKIYYYSDPTKIWSLGAFQKRYDLGAIEFARNKKDSSQFAHSQDVDFAWATGMLLTRAVLEATGGFDPSFFVYYEEADLCQRAKKLGYRIRSVPAARMWHKIAQSARSPWIARNWSRSKMIYFRKHSRGWHKLFLIGYAYFYAFFHALKQTEQGGNRGPLISAIQGLTQGLFYPIYQNTGT